MSGQACKRERKIGKCNDDDAQNSQIIKDHYLNKNEWLIKKKKMKKSKHCTRSEVIFGVCRFYV